MAICKEGVALRTLEDWERLAGPKSATQWVDGRSAKEAARAWLEAKESLPAEIEAALATHPAFGKILSWDAEPEARLRFDRFAGEPRNSDLAIHARDAHGPFLIAVEAKADEPFGETTAETLAAALERYLENGRSNGILRVQQLASALFHPRAKGGPAVKDIRYQLLTACAGAICEAQRHGYGRAAMLVHEFVTDKTLDEKHHRNARDLDLFVQRLSSGTVAQVCAGELRGPFPVPGSPLFDGSVRLFIGKARRNLRQAVA